MRSPRIGTLRVGLIGVFASLVGILMTGCSFGPTLYPVEGQVLLDNDAPLAKGSVMFWPDAAKGNQFKGQPTGEVEGGKFKLKTQGSDGAPLGWYKVTVTETV